MHQILAKLRSQAWWNRRFILLSEFVGHALLSHRKRGTENNQPRHIGLIVLHQIGDMALATPTITAIRQMFPSAHLTIIAGTGPAQLISTNPWDADVITFDAIWQPVVRRFTQRQTDIMSARRAFQEVIFSLHADILLAFQPDRIVNQLMVGAAPRTVGFSDAGGGFFLTNPLPDQGCSFDHQIEINYLLARELGQIYQVAVPVRPPAQLMIIPKAITSINHRRESATTNKKIAIFHPYPSDPKRAWASSHWQEIAQWFIKQHVTPIVIGGSNDHFASWPQGTLDWTGTLSLPETLALLAQASIVVAIDSGPGHLAAAVGTPVVSIFSATNDPKKWAPFGPKVTTLLPPPSKTWEGIPYEDRKLATGTQINPYTEGITVSTVIEAIRHYLDQR